MTGVNWPKAKYVVATSIALALTASSFTSIASADPVNVDSGGQLPYAGQSDAALGNNWPNDPWDTPVENVVNWYDGTPTSISWDNQWHSTRAVDQYGNLIDPTDAKLEELGDILPRNPSAGHAPTSATVNRVVRVNDANSDIDFLSYTSYGGINMNLPPFPAMTYHGAADTPSNGFREQQSYCASVLPLTPNVGYHDDDRNGTTDIGEFKREAIDWEVCGYPEHPNYKGAPPQVVDAFFKESVSDPINGQVKERKQLVAGAAWVWYDPNVQYNSGDPASERAAYLSAYPWRFDENEAEDPMLRPEYAAIGSNLWFNHLGPRGAIKPPHCCEYNPYFPGLGRVPVNAGWVLSWQNYATHVGSLNYAEKPGAQLWKPARCNTTPTVEGVLPGANEYGVIANIADVGPKAEPGSHTVAIIPSTADVITGERVTPRTPSQVRSRKTEPQLENITWTGVASIDSVSEGSLVASGAYLRYTPPDVNHLTYLNPNGTLRGGRAGPQGFDVSVTVTMRGQATWRADWLVGWSHNVDEINRDLPAEYGAVFRGNQEAGTYTGSPGVQEEDPLDWRGDSRGFGYSSKHTPIFQNRAITSEFTYQVTGQIKVCPRLPQLNDVWVDGHGAEFAQVNVLTPGDYGDPVFLNEHLSKPVLTPNGQQPKKGYFVELSDPKGTTLPTGATVFEPIAGYRSNGFGFIWLPALDYNMNTIDPTKGGPVQLTYQSCNLNNKCDNATITIVNVKIDNPT